MSFSEDAKLKYRLSFDVELAAADHVLQNARRTFAPGNLITALYRKGDFWFMMHVYNPVDLERTVYVNGKKLMLITVRRYDEVKDRIQHEEAQKRLETTYSKTAWLRP